MIRPVASLAGRQVVILASIDWGAAWQRHQAWAARFAAAGHRVFFVENTGFRDFRRSDAWRILRRVKAAGVPSTPPRPGIEVVSPLVLPPTRGPFRAANRGLFVPRLVSKLRRLGLGPKPVVVAYLPTATTLELLDRLGASLVVYDCVDNFEGHESPPADLKETEGELLRRAALVLTTSPFLREKCAARNRNVHELHHGVDESFFAAQSPAPREYRSFCYFGSLWSAIEYAYPKALAEAGFDVTLLGPAREPPPPLPERVKHLAAVSAARLPVALAPFDALLLPYADTEYNRGVVPAKTYECLATGKPVLASPLPGLGAFRDHFYLLREPAAWARAAAELPKTETEAKRRARVELARRHTTKAQFEKLVTLLSKC